MHAAVEQADEQLDQFVADAAQSFAKDIGPQQQHGADLRFVQRLAQSAGVAAHQVALQLLEVSGADAHIGQFAEAGVDAIGRFVAGDNALHDGLRCRDSPAGLRAQWLRPWSRPATWLICSRESGCPFSSRTPGLRTVVMLTIVRGREDLASANVEGNAIS